MTTLVYIDKTKVLGNRTLNALQLINRGFAELKALDGQRAQLIGESQTAMQAGFGTDLASSAQALSDRMASVTSVFYGGSDSFAISIHDLIDAAIDGAPPA